MKRSIMPLLTASLALGVAVSQANASFTYDLRVVSGPTAATNNGQTVVNPLPGDYTLQIWGQITGDTNPTNDAYLAGWFNVSSSTGTASGLAFSGAGTGVTSLTMASRFELSSTGIGQSNLSNDGVADWGSADQSSTANWAIWQTTSALAAGGTTGDAVNANTWEVLLGTLTVHVANVATPAGADLQTDFTVGVPAVSGNFGYTQILKKPIVYNLDGSTGVTAATAGITSTPVIFDVTATNTPEPASLGVLGLGVLGLLVHRRRK